MKRLVPCLLVLFAAAAQAESPNASPQPMFQSTLTRAEVAAEVIKARATGMLPGAGEVPIARGMAGLPGA